jgi:hypothetical protein
MSQKVFNSIFLSLLIQIITLCYIIIYEVEFSRELR